MEAQPSDTQIHRNKIGANMEIYKRFTFDAAHSLLTFRRSPVQHLHGHRFSVTVHLEGEVDRNRLGQDFGEIKPSVHL